MFITKRAEEEFINLVKRAKELLSGSSEEKTKYPEIVSLITKGDTTEAMKAVIGLENSFAFFDSQEFKGLPKAEQDNFRSSYDSNLANLQNITGMTPDEMRKKQEKDAEKAAKEAVEEATPEVAPEDEDKANLDAVPGSDDATATKDLDAALEEVEASIFEYLPKKAVSAVDTTVVEEPASLDGKILEVIKASVDYGVANGMDDDAIIAMAKADVGRDDASVEAAVKDCLANVHRNDAMTVESYTQRVASLLDDYNAYTPDPDTNEKILQIAKSSSTSIEFLTKIAQELDESPKGAQQYPGQKVFDGKHVTFEGGATPKFPGQKVFMGREGGNPEVESILTISSKPEVDVYKDKAGREKVTKITDKNGGTIAFMQPVAIEGEDITVGFDYNGIVGGEIQRTKDNVGEPKAEAAHTTQNYLDTINELADKKPEDLAGKFPKRKASQEEGLTKEAGFVFQAGLKKKANDETELGTTLSGNTLQNDSMIGVPTDVKSGKHVLTPEELVEYQKRFKEREDSIQRASGFVFHITKQAEDETLYPLAVAMLDQLRSEFPAAYTAVQQAAQTGDDTTFQAVLKQAIQTNLRNGNPQVDSIVHNLPFGKIKVDYFKELPEEEPKEEPKETKEKEDKPDTGKKPEGKEETSEDAADTLSDLLGA